MHDCQYCGMACDCDGEDHYQPAPEDCMCPCEDLEDEDDDYDWLDAAFERADDKQE